MGDIHPDLAKVLVNEEAIQERVSELAVEISSDYQNVDKLLVIAILKGAFIFAADLTRQLNIPHVVDFMALTSYGKSTSSGEVRIVMDLREPIQHEHVLLVEDIVDSGNTLRYLHRLLQDRKPDSVRTCVMVKKESDNLDTQIDYVGFEIPDVWLVGYGLDYAERHRTLPYISELKPEVYR
jgi:hypoxanthine phosphoribosyltransferase